MECRRTGLYFYSLHRIFTNFLAAGILASGHGVGAVARGTVRFPVLLLHGILDLGRTLPAFRNHEITLPSVSFRFMVRSKTAQSCNPARADCAADLDGGAMGGLPDPREDPE